MLGVSKANRNYKRSGFESRRHHVVKPRSEAWCGARQSISTKARLSGCPPYRAEILHEAGRLEHDLAVLDDRCGGELVHEGTPLGLGRDGRVQAVLQRGGGEPLQGAEAQVPLAERLLDDLALDGQAQRAVDGA